MRFPFSRTRRGGWLQASAWAATLTALSACSSRKAAVAPRPTRAALSTLAERSHVAVTVYNQDLGLVRERRKVALGTGLVALTFRDVAEKLQPETVTVRSLSAPGKAQVLEQNYRYDLLSPETLLKKYVGKSLRVYRYNEQLGRDEVKTARVLAVEKGLVLELDGEITSGASLGRLAFPELPKNLVSQPTLEWLLESGSPEQELEVSYLSRGLSWKADYVLGVEPDETHAELTSWVSLLNESGASFENAELKLVAGDVNRVTQAMVPLSEMDMADESASAAAPGMRRESLSEYHLYRLASPTTLRHKEQKQVSLFGSARVNIQKKLLFEAPAQAMPLLVPQAPAAKSPEQAQVVLEFTNNAQSGLGIPLPKGIMRAYTRDSAGAAQFIGEDQIAHSPRDELVRLRIGKAFDVVLERTALKRSQVSRCSVETDWALDIRNHKDQSQAVEVLEQTEGQDYELVSSSLPAVRKTRDHFSFELSIPARGTSRIEYRIRVRTC